MDILDQIRVHARSVEIRLQVDKQQNVRIITGHRRILAYRALGATTVRGMLSSGVIITVRIEDLLPLF